MPPDLFVGITEQLAVRGRRIVRKIALTDEPITLEGLPQSFHGMFDDTIVIALRLSEVSEFDKLPNHRARRDPTPKWKDSTHARPIGAVLLYSIYQRDGKRSL